MMCKLASVLLEIKFKCCELAARNPHIAAVFVTESRIFLIFNYQEEHSLNEGHSISSYVGSLPFLPRRQSACQNLIHNCLRF